MRRAPARFPSFVALSTAAALVVFPAPPAFAEPPAPPIPPPGVAAPVVPAAPVAPRPLPDDPVSIRYTGGIAVAGAGLLAVVLGTVLGIRATVDKNAIGDHCNHAARCDLAGYTLGSEAHDFALLSTAFIAVGGVAAAVGIGLAVTAAPRKTGVAAWVAPRPGGVVLGGRW